MEDSVLGRRRLLELAGIGLGASALGFVVGRAAVT